MQFANPWFLLGLLAIGIPVIIHLFNFRRFRRVYFTNVRFIEELKLQTRKQSKLKHLLVLLARILAVCSLVLAFAQPYVPLDSRPVHTNARNAVSVYLDNSFSMESRSSRGSLLDEARIKAGEIAAAYRPSDLFQVLTTDFEGRHQRFISRDETVDALADLQFSPATRPLSEVIKRQTDLFSTAGSAHKSVFIVSDFQRSTTDLEKLKGDSLVPVYLVPLPSLESSNLFIDSIWFDHPVAQLNQQTVLTVRIRNTGGESREKNPVKLMVNNSQRALASFDCPALGEVTVEMTFTHHEAGICHAWLEITDYPITYDDRFNFSYPVFTTVPVLCVNEQENNAYLDHLFGGDSTFTYTPTQLRSLDYSSLGSYRLMILNEIRQFPSGLFQEMTKFLEKGGSILVIPPPEMEPDTWQAILGHFNLGTVQALDTAGSRLMKLDAGHGLYRDVFEKIPENLDLPAVLSHYPLRMAAGTGSEVILSLENLDPFLVSYEREIGKIYLLASPLRQQFTSFGKHVLFVPTLFKIALLSQPVNRLYYQIGEDAPVGIIGVTQIGEQVFRIRKLDGDYEFIPETRMAGSGVVFFPHDQVREAGNYVILDGSRVVSGVSFNYNRKESAMAFYSADDLRKLAEQLGLERVSVLDTGEKPVTMQIEELNKGISLWKLFIILSLVFLGAEVLILRLWKTV